MLCHVKYFADAAVRLMHSSNDSVQVKPAEVDREDPFQDRREKEGRQGNADQGKHCHRIINPAVLLRRRNDTERNRNQNFQDK